MDEEDAWRTELEKANAMRADRLLQRMRPKIEETLQECAKRFGSLMPTCQSQRTRAQRAYNLIKESVEKDRSPTKGWLEWSHTLVKLGEFLSVHDTVRILEYPDNHPWIPKE